MPRHIVPTLLICFCLGFQAVAQDTTSTNTAQDIDALNTRVVQLYREGRYAEAAVIARQVIELRKRQLGENHPNYATILNMLAMLHVSMGDYAKAEPLYKQAMTIWREALGEDHPSYGASLSNLAGLYDLMGDYAKAEPLYKQAREITRKAMGEEHPSYITILNNLAGLYRAMGNYAKVEPLCEQALEIWRKALGEDHPNCAESLRNLALLWADQGKHAEAHEFLGRAASIEQDMAEQVLTFMSQRQAMKFIKSRPLSTALLLSHTAQHLPDDSGARADALNAQLRRKGAVLAAHRRFQGAILQSGDPKALKLFDELGRARSAIANLTFAGPGETPLEAYRKRLDALREQADELEGQLARKSQAYAAGRETRRAGCQEVAAALSDDAALLEFARTRMYDFKESKFLPSHYLAFVLRAGKPEDVALVDLDSASEIDALVAALRTAVTPNTTAEDAVEAGIKQAGRRLYARVFAPLLPHLGSAKLVFLSPDGSLNLLPFEILVDEQGDYLIDEYDFNYLATGRDVVGFGLLDAEPHTGPLLMGDPDFDLGKDKRWELLDSLGLRRAEMPASHSARMSGFNFKPLPGARKEVEAISRMLEKQEPQLYVGPQALEEVLLAQRAPRYLHLATHGFFLEDQKMDLDKNRGVGGLMSLSGKDSLPPLPAGYEDPLIRSGLALAGANGGLKSGDTGDSDGLLTAAEILDMKLQGTELVTLSACETGLGDVQTGEGVFGLRRVITQAGAKSLVMSMWSVPDKETEELMRRFYGNLLD